MEGKIYSSICAVMDDIGAVGKNQTTTGYASFKFRGIDDVMNALKPLLAKHKVFVVPTVLEQSREERVNSKGNTLIYSIMKVKYTYYAEDGSSIESIVIGEGMDSGDKASNKAMASALKYSFFQVFCIPTEETKDPDSETHQLGAKQEVTPETKLNSMMIKTVQQQAKRTGLTEEQIAGMCKEKAVKDIPVKYYQALMDRLKQMPDSEK